MSSPTSRSLKLLRDAGYTADTVERYNSFIKRRNDLYGFGDILAFKNDEVLIVQTTSGANLLARVAKIKLIPAADDWIKSPNRKIHAHGWSKRGPRGKAKRWACRTIEVTQTGTKELCGTL